MNPSHFHIQYVSFSLQPYPAYHVYSVTGVEL